MARHAAATATILATTATILAATAAATATAALTYDHMCMDSR
jgi:hypothetical protein